MMATRMTRPSGRSAEERSGAEEGDRPTPTVIRLARPTCGPFAPTGPGPTRNQNAWARPERKLENHGARGAFWSPSVS
eukprot:g23364.t1